MIELLASMCGAAFSYEQRERCDDDTSTTPTSCGQFIVAINPFLFKPQDQSNEMLFEKIIRDNGRLPSTGKHCGSERMKIRQLINLLTSIYFFLPKNVYIYIYNTITIITNHHHKHTPFPMD